MAPFDVVLITEILSSRSTGGPPPSRGGGGRFENPDPSNVIGVFGLSMDTREADLEDLFDRVGKTEKVTIGMLLRPLPYLENIHLIAT